MPHHTQRHHEGFKNLDFLPSGKSATMRALSHLLTRSYKPT